jgi:osmoprotectant transport system permease protein
MSYLAANPERVAALLGQHVVLVVASLAIALAVALPLGVAAERHPRAGAAILGVTGAIYAIPSLALLAILVTALGLGPFTAIVALAAYAQMVLIRAIVAGLRGVDAAIVDAARGLGMTARQTLVRVEFPAALPVMLAGVRVATVSLIALATIAAWIDAGGLGVLIFDGIRSNNAPKIVAGAIASGVLAIAADALLRGAERAVRR